MKQGGRPLLKPQEAASRLSVSPRKVYKLVAEGSLPGVRLGASVRIDPTRLEEFVAQGGTRGEQR